ncbi:50S ribosomal protein L5 [Candidatus Wolfebacteria bacterium RIFCSPLOWO2_01_FULL_45_19]|uniref:50S ribosomal protein L5 n=1 Tax=Candidatus Wolfebacteria bacterium RIFCSPLOWO2_01_FULL_45_19 TaxID=1802557 RepID=A0A1F8DSL2_9BACT|nr:MAG: 50S ribosomal protein L5 [Candidatus Wolfebacteria bacterium RIFCSPLOWO2_01_FULL_45_19]
MQKMQSDNLKLEKIVVNVGVGRLSQAPNFSDKILPEIDKELALITGQKPSPRGAKQSIAGFKIRAGNVVGLKVTLRGKRMRDFLSRLVNIALPRVRDFRGVDLKNVDKSGNLSIGFREHSVFPEINLETSRVNFGLEVTLVPKIRIREKAIEAYRQLGVPFKK